MNVGDRVQVAVGVFAGQFGTVQYVATGLACVELDDETYVTLPMSALRPGA